MESVNKLGGPPGTGIGCAAGDGQSKDGLLRLIRLLGDIRGEMLRFTSDCRGAALGDTDPAYAKSAENLLHYLALRRHDLRQLQSELAGLGLSSLGRSESHVMATVEAVLETLRRLAGCSHEVPEDTATLDFKSAKLLLEEHTERLLGPAPERRNVYIMVTMSSGAAEDYALVRGLLESGMNCMRINCAHDVPEEWAGMIGNLGRAREETGKTCKIIMDLPGPKLRTGPLRPGPCVLKYRPVRDAYGRVTKPAKILLRAEGAPETEDRGAFAAVLTVSGEWLKKIHLGGTVRFVDARGSRRSMRITEWTEEGFRADAVRTAYITPETLLRLKKRDGLGEWRTNAAGIAPQENFITLGAGDTLILAASSGPGSPAERDADGRVTSPAVIGCTIPEILGSVNAGDPVWFDDGKIGGVVEEKTGGGLRIRITHTSSRAAKLGSGKGINLPGSKLDLPAITPGDVSILEFASEHADIVAMSFANTAEDVKSLLAHIKRLGKGEPGIVLKIETHRGFANLPSMLLEAMKSPSCGVMIARGDLAVETGFERLAEVQEEILWLCEAAHVPAIWATQVLESLARQGSATRAEITDAAMGHRAECVMLNKGAHILDALETLDDILKRMQSHQVKKTAMLRELRLAYNFPHE
ncbi:MAG: pyruvate kinase [Candidatus Dadabacteria bacterium]|nr:pyruvate kinase [Candidatus Dadabacteria bacterium]